MIAILVCKASRKTKIRLLLRESENLLLSRATDETKYNQIFNRIKRKLDNLDFTFDWYDPDESYLVDALAYINAAQKEYRQRYGDN